jgi:hypothetical protein
MKEENSTVEADLSINQLQQDEFDAVPKDFLCCINQHIMKNPVSIYMLTYILYIRVQY